MVNTFTVWCMDWIKSCVPTISCLNLSRDTAFSVSPRLSHCVLALSTCLLLSESLRSLVPCSRRLLSWDTLCRSAMRFSLSLSASDRMMLWGRRRGDRLKAKKQDVSGKECRAVNVMYRHRHHVSQCYFHPPLQKSEPYVKCPLLFSVTTVHTVETEKKNHTEMTNQNEGKKGLA